MPENEMGAHFVRRGARERMFILPTEFENGMNFENLQKLARKPKNLRFYEMYFTTRKYDPEYTSNVELLLPKGTLASDSVSIHFYQSFCKTEECGTIFEGP